MYFNFILQMFLLDIGQRLRVYEAEYHVLKEADLISEDHSALQDYKTDLEKNYTNIYSGYEHLRKQNKDLIEQLKVSIF